MNKEIVLKVIDDLKKDSKCLSDAMNMAIDNFINGISDYDITNYDNPFLFVEDVYCVLENPTTMELSDIDAEIIDCMNDIAHDINDLL